MSSQLSSMRTRRGSPLAIVPATTALPASPSTVSVTSDANVPASLVLRSLTVMPRFLARKPALIRLTRSLVAFSRMPAQSGRGELGGVVVGQVAGHVDGEGLDPAAEVLGARCGRAISVRGRYGAIARAVSGVSSGALTA